MNQIATITPLMDLGISYSPDLSPKQEVVLSWLQGRAPIGQWFECKIFKEMLPDLAPYRDHAVISHVIKRLVDKGFIERRRNPGRASRLIRVIRTLEQSKLS